MGADACRFETSSVTTAALIHVVVSRARHRLDLRADGAEPGHHLQRDPHAQLRAGRDADGLDVRGLERSAPLGLPLLAALLVAVLAAALLALVFERLVIRRAIGATHWDVLIITLGLSLILRAGGGIVWSHDEFPFPSFFSNRPDRAGPGAGRAGIAGHHRRLARAHARAGRALPVDAPGPRHAGGGAEPARRAAHGDQRRARVLAAPGCWPRWSAPSPACWWRR